jgi:hypothetical protein
MKLRSWLVTSIPLVLLAAPSFSQVRLLGIDTTPTGNTLYEVDPTTGALTSLGPVTGIAGAIGALTYDSAGDVLYLSSTSNDALYRLDYSTLVATHIGDYNVGTAVVMHGLEYVQSTGRLYGKSSAESNGADFFEVDKVTGLATPVGLSGIGGFGGLVYVNGTMYFSDINTDQLLTIDLTNGVTSTVGPFGAGTNLGVAFAYDPAYGLIATDNLGDSLYSVDPSTGAATLITAHMPLNIISLAFVGGGSIGTPYCAVVPNSTGGPGELSASGSVAVSVNDVTLAAESLPTNAFGFFLTSLTQGFVANPGGSQGNLCLGGSIGRYVGAGQIMNSGASGSFALQIDLTQTPTPVGPVAVAPGETWNFQTWHRDAVAGSATSNFTNGLSITFN